MPAATARPRGRPAWSSATSPDSPPRSAKKALARATAPPAWQTPAMRLAEAQKRASSATGAGDHREALKWHLRALALAKVHVAAVTAAGGRLSREEATAAARTHMAIAETYEASKGLGLAFSGAGTTTGDGDEENARGTDVLRVLDREASDMAGLTQAVTHLQHAIGACATTSASVSGGPSCEFSEQNARAAGDKLEARARLGPRLLAVGRAEDAAETTRRALEAMGSFRDSETESSATEPSASETSPRVSSRRENRNAKEIETRLALLLCAADAERTVGERFASRARAACGSARARARGGGGVGGGRPGILRGGTLREGLRAIRAIRRRGVRGEGAAFRARARRTKPTRGEGAPRRGGAGVAAILCVRSEAGRSGTTRRRPIRRRTLRGGFAGNRRSPRRR